MQNRAEAWLKVQIVYNSVYTITKVTHNNICDVVVYGMCMKKIFKKIFYFILKMGEYKKINERVLLKKWEKKG